MGAGNEHIFIKKGDVMRKIGEINIPTFGIIAYYHDDKDKYNPYKMYHKEWTGRWHKRLIAKYGDFKSVMYHTLDITNGKYYGRCFKDKA